MGLMQSFYRVNPRRNEPIQVGILAVLWRLAYPPFGLIRDPDTDADVEDSFLLLLASGSRRSEVLPKYHMMIDGSRYFWS